MPDESSAACALCGAAPTEGCRRPDWLSCKREDQAAARNPLEGEIGFHSVPREIDPLPERPTGGGGIPPAEQGQDDTLPVLGGHAASKHLMGCEREMEEVLRQGRGDVEGVHYDADQILCRALKLLGYRKLVALYEDVPKWYA